MLRRSAATAPNPAIQPVLLRPLRVVPRRAPLALTAWACYLENLLGYAFVFIFVSYMTRFQIVFEEAALLEKFELEFEVYCKQVRRWL